MRATEGNLAISTYCFTMTFCYDIYTSECHPLEIEQKSENIAAHAKTNIKEGAFKVEMVPFYKKFPKLAEKETRCIIIRENSDLPPGKYFLLESYCNDPNCDCRRIYISTLHKDGDVLKVGNEEYSLRIDFKDKQSSSARITENNINLIISSNLSKELQNKHISTLLSRCIAGKRLPKLKEKINELNNKHFNQKINKIFFKHNKSNWGSCSEAGNINISTRLLLAPDDVLEYVCIHELAHLIEPNHSDRFWALVEKAIPDYKEKINWLKENGNKCKF